VVGEVGLGGEIRTIHQIEKRIGEARKLGFTRLILPRNNLKGVRRNGDMTLTEVETLDQAIAALSTRSPT
jgi:DNA repair protein RadA/Sms